MKILNHQRHPLQDILKRLMSEVGISEAELVRQTGIAQTTINRLLNSDLDPRMGTLRPIAQYFGVTIGQLLGDELLHYNRIKGETNPSYQAAWRSVPIISWEKIQSWPFQRHNITPLNHTQWIVTERHMSDKCYALHAKSYMEPRFKKNSVLLIDTELTVKDGHFVIVSLHNTEPTARRAFYDGDKLLLEPLRAGSETLKYSKKDALYGVIVEARLDYDI